MGSGELGVNCLPPICSTRYRFRTHRTESARRPPRTRRQSGKNYKRGELVSYSGLLLAFFVALLIVFLPGSSSLISSDLNEATYSTNITTTEHWSTAWKGGNRAYSRQRQTHRRATVWRLAPNRLHGHGFTNFHYQCLISRRLDKTLTRLFKRLE